MAKETYAGDPLGSISSTENKRRKRIRAEVHKMTQWIKKGACLCLSFRISVKGEN